MDPVSAMILVLVLAGPAAYTMNVFRHAREHGRAMPSGEDWKPRMPVIRTARAKSPKGAITGRQQIRRITAAAGTAAAGKWNAVASRGPKVTTRRADGTVAGRMGVLRRIVVPVGSNGRSLGQPDLVPIPATPGGTVTTDATEATEASAPAEPPSPITSSHNGSGGGGGGASADFFHAITAVTGPAKAGGLRSKQRAVKTLAAGLPMMASALEEFARWCQEPAQNYGSPLFERLQRMANCIRAGGLEGADADSYMTTLGSKRLDEVAGSSVHAPSSRELNTE